MAELVPTLGFLLNVGESGDVIDVRSESLVVQCKRIKSSQSKKESIENAREGQRTRQRARTERLSSSHYLDIVLLLLLASLTLV